jgi:protein-S-isoprenylcysteine O-methyltransferase Ste14
VKTLHILLRPLFAVSLFASQFASTRSTFLSDKTAMLAVGGALILAGVLLVILASLALRDARRRSEVAQNGPFRYSRHPIYISVYLLTAGLGLLFFTWVWFLVMLVFVPLWYLECREEEKEMVQLHGLRYLEYKSRTGMFWPRIV